MIILITAVIWIFNVSKKVNAEDREYIIRLLEIEPSETSFSNYEEEIEFLLAIQEDFNNAIELGPSIPQGKAREPKDLFEKKIGECYDRSRFLEKAYSMYGFKTRHIALFTLRYGAKKLRSLLTPNHISHSTFEVKTSKGWLLMDPNFNWVALDSDNMPMAYPIIGKALRNGDDIQWKKVPPKALMHFYIQESFGIYGLYSRHGKFYAPYLPVPDYNFRDLLYNIFR